jgi:hypothetical protein
MRFQSASNPASSVLLNNNWMMNRINNSDEELLDAVLLTPKPTFAPLHQFPQHRDADMQESSPKKIKLSPPPLVQKHEVFVDRLVDFHASDSTLSLPCLERDDFQRDFHLSHRPTKLLRARYGAAPRLQLRQRTSSEPNMASESILLQPRIRHWNSDDMHPRSRQRSVSYEMPLLPSFRFEVDTDGHEDNDEDGSVDQRVCRN